MRPIPILCSIGPSYSTAQRLPPHDDSEDDLFNDSGMCSSLPPLHWHSKRGKRTEDRSAFWARYREPVPAPQTEDPSAFWARYREPVPAPQQTPSTPPRRRGVASTTPRRHEVASTPPRRLEVQQTTSNLGDPTRLEIALSAWILDFAEVSITISPRRGAAEAREVSQRSATPIIAAVHHHREATASPAPASPAPTPERMQARLLTGPHPIYPLQPGEMSPPQRIFRDNRAHGYYVVFQGLRIGIYHEYWFVYLVIILIHQILIYIGRSDIEPYLRRGHGGHFRKGQTLEDAKALWNNPNITKRVIN